MSIGSKTVALVASAGVLALGWQVGAARQQAMGAIEPPASTTEVAPTGHPTASSVSASPRADQTIASSVPTTASAVPAPPTSPTATPAPPPTHTLAGVTVTHKYGTVKVSATLTAGKITNVTAQTTSVDSKSTTITRNALPVLRSRVLAADSAAVSSVSGATYTSEAYLTSLQSALDKA